nr:protein ANTAGONIST OF LIKE HETEROCHROMATIN PROTEIN 1-like [Leptinotarsa decemlineata]
MFFRFLATGDSYRTIGYSFCLGERTVSKIVHEVCSSLWSQLQPTFLKMPDEKSWNVYELEFRERWQFPKCVGAIDGKHVIIKAPPNSGSSYFNYKKTFSVVLMAIASANYQLIAVDIGSAGRFSDGGIFANSPIGRRLKTNSFHLPESSPMENYNDINFPFVIVGDEAFPLMVNLMRPFPRRSLNKENRVFNYRLSRARRVIENTFGILAARFRIYKRPLECKLESIDSIIKATCILHNYLGTREGRCPNINEELLEKGNSNNQWLPLAHRGSRATTESFVIRQNFCNYFNSNIGRIPWRDKIV